MQSSKDTSSDLLRARTCYPQGYLDKPRTSSSSDRSKRILIRQNDNHHSSTSLLLNEDHEIHNNNKYIYNDLNIKKEKNEFVSSNHEIVSECSYETKLIQDANRALKCINKMRLSSTVIGPVYSLLNDICDDSCIKAVIKDAIPIESLSAFLVVNRDDEELLRYEFQRKSISNHIYFVDKQHTNYTSELPYDVAATESFHYKRKFLIDQIFQNKNYNNNSDKKPQSLPIEYQIVRAFLCAAHNLEDILWVEELSTNIQLSYLFFDSKTSNSSSRGDYCSKPFILYCKTFIPDNSHSTLARISVSFYYRPDSFRSYLKQQIYDKVHPNPDHVKFVITKYTRPSFPDYQKIISDYKTLKINTRLLFSTAIIPKSAQPQPISAQPSVFTATDTNSLGIFNIVPKPNNIKSQSDLLLPYDIEIIYPFYYVIAHEKNRRRSLRDKPVHLKSIYEQRISGSTTNAYMANKKITDVHSNWNFTLIPVRTINFTPHPDQTFIGSSNQYGFWIPCNASTLIHLQQYLGVGDWTDNLSYYTDDGWFLPLNTLIDRLANPDSKIVLESIPLRATEAWNLSKRNITLENLSISNNLPIIGMAYDYPIKNDLQHIFYLLESKVRDKKHMKMPKNMRKFEIFGKNCSCSNYNTVDLCEWNMNYLYTIQEDSIESSSALSSTTTNHSINSPQKHHIDTTETSITRYQTRHTIPQTNSSITSEILNSKPSLDTRLSFIFKKSKPMINTTISSEVQSSKIGTNNVAAFESSDSNHQQQTNNMISFTANNLSPTIIPTSSSTDSVTIITCDHETGNQTMTPESIEIKKRKLVQVSDDAIADIHNNGYNTNSNNSITTTNTTIATNDHRSVTTIDNIHTWDSIKSEILLAKKLHKKLDTTTCTKEALRLLDIDRVIADNQNSLEVFKLLQNHLQISYNIPAKHVELILSAQIELSEAIKLLLQPATTTTKS